MFNHVANHTSLKKDSIPLVILKLHAGKMDLMYDDRLGYMDDCKKNNIHAVVSLFPKGSFPGPLG